MRKLLALVMFAVLACGGGAGAGALGTVEIEPGQPIEIRAVLSDSVVPSVSRVLQTAIEIATDDVGPIHGYLGRTAFEPAASVLTPPSAGSCGTVVTAGRGCYHASRSDRR